MHRAAKIQTPARSSRRLSGLTKGLGSGCTFFLKSEAATEAKSGVVGCHDASPATETESWKRHFGNLGRALCSPDRTEKLPRLALFTAFVVLQRRIPRFPVRSWDGL